MILDRKRQCTLRYGIVLVVSVLPLSASGASCDRQLYSPCYPRHAMIYEIHAMHSGSINLTSPSGLFLKRTGVSKPHSEQYTPRIVSIRAMAPMLERVEHELARVDASSECCPYPDIHIALPENASPIDELRVLSTTFAWDRKANHHCPAYTCLLEIVAYEDLIESEVFIFGDAP